MESENVDMNIIPPQIAGGAMDAVEKRFFETEAEAKTFFENTSKRLLSVNEWGKYAGMSSFQLMDAHGIRADRTAEPGDFIRIDIPGPGTHAGMGYDWVRVKEIKELSNHEEQISYIIVQPCSHPMDKDGAIAHFFKDDATSTFIIRKFGLVVSAEEHGRNEIPNTDHGKFLDKSRNFVVGMAAKVGLSYPQWKNLVKGLLQN
ncbi:hypothetical protein [Pedobacter rhodius]|uniref:Uncharacterized protein n=1 Tax=Pedobacter rhodius TaxID=3004098 RepID=A0ABT4KSJ9_9SPHI|nr:hypothetical protein [Pedobacter sp. SJ11]MCZ4221907.1 hypothetical protein [Pedobacter sp. SJ11]